MTNSIFIQTFSGWSKYDSGSISIEEINFKRPTITHDEVLEFRFAPLEDIMNDLLKSGHSSEDVKKVITGLSELPEYDTNRRNINSKKAN